MTPNHINNLHNITNPPNLPILHEKIKNERKAKFINNSK